MLLLPLGLNSKVYKVPWATCALVVAILIVSFQNFDAVSQTSYAYTRSETFFQLLQTRLSLAAELCQKKETIFSNETCQSLQKISGQKIHNLTQPLLQIQDEFRKNSGREKMNRKDEHALQELLFTSKALKEHEALLAGSPHWATLQSAEKQFGQEVLDHQTSHGLLSRSNWNLFTLSKAQFIHAGLMHLFGNLLFFAFLSVFVELRVGSLIYVLLYLVGGYAGLSAQLLLSDPGSHTALMGASANISGIAGAFTLFFWKKHLRVWMSYFFIDNRVLSLPVYFFFPVLVLAGDILGALNSNGHGVAHWAHLGGFASGVLIAFGVRKLDNLPEDFSYLEEYLNFQKSLKLDAESQWKAWVELLQINPENRTIHSSFFASLFKNRDWNSLPKVQRYYLKFQFPNYLKSLSRQPRELFDVLDSIPLNWPPGERLKLLSTKELRALFLKAEDQHRIQSAYFLLDSLMESHPQLRLDPELDHQRNRLRNQLPGRPHAEPA